MAYRYLGIWICGIWMSEFSFFPPTTTHTLKSVQDNLEQWVKSQRIPLSCTTSYLIRKNTDRDHLLHANPQLVSCSCITFHPYWLNRSGEVALPSIMDGRMDRVIPIYIQNFNCTGYNTSIQIRGVILYLVTVLSLELFEGLFWQHTSTIPQEWKPVKL